MIRKYYLIFVYYNIAGCNPVNIRNLSELHQTASNQEHIFRVFLTSENPAGGTKEKIRFYDTAGLDSQQREVPRHLLAAADGFVIVYSVEDKQSFTLAEAIRKEIKNCGEKKDQVVLVLGTKVDLAESRKVDSGQAQVINFGWLWNYFQWDTMYNN